MISNYTMKGHSEEGNNNWCNIHPTEVFVGVCALCLKERLLILLASSSSSSKHPRRSRSSRRSHHIYVLQKVSALGSFLRRSNSSRGRQQKLDSTDDDDMSIISQEDSFISIKFGDDGCASWDKGGDAKPSSSVQGMNLKLFPSSNHDLNEKLYTTSTVVKKMTTSSSVVEHNYAGPRGGTLRWRKRVGQVLFQFVRLKRSTMESSCHVSTTGKVKGLKTRNKGWIKTLTKRRDHA
ncbi:Uncharacterized protein family UPF0503 [Macleaya cordata]|uniref:Uncharacterized protein family UPF0503 n=1 Tax=Macleaya cordata TaxID=56857 RepID=A0A200Q6W1_MACCD|nr:Uncharacterized protein family UPF0503 [Macleaya cordata]